MVNLSIIKNICKAKRLSISDLSNESGITYQGINRMIRTNTANIESLEKIANAFGMELVEFIYEASEDNINKKDINKHIHDSIENPDMSILSQSLRSGNFTTTFYSINTVLKMAKLLVKERINAIEVNLFNFIHVKKYIEKCNIGISIELPERTLNNFRSQVNGHYTQSSEQKTRFKKWLKATAKSQVMAVISIDIDFNELTEKKYMVLKQLIEENFTTF